MKLNIYSQNSGAGGTVFVIVLSFHNVEKKLQIKIQIKLIFIFFRIEGQEELFFRMSGLSLFYSR